MYILFSYLINISKRNYNYNYINVIYYLLFLILYCNNRISYFPDNLYNVSCVKTQNKNKKKQVKYSKE